MLISPAPVRLLYVVAQSLAPVGVVYTLQGPALACGAGLALLSHSCLG